LQYPTTKVFHLLGSTIITRQVQSIHLYYFRWSKGFSTDYYL